MKNVFIFTIGAAIGSVVTWKLIERKYKDIADEEIASVVETFKNRKPINIVKEKIAEVVEKTNKSKNESIIDKEQYNTISNLQSYLSIIKPEEYGTEDNKCLSYIYYSDDVLTDENNQILLEPEKLIGSDALNHFGEYEDDSVYVRDSKNNIDYEILKSEKMFFSENNKDNTD